MHAWQAFVLGIVEGITEYLPVSSTGHLILTERLLGLPNDEATRAFVIVIQAGAIVAVLSIFLARVRRMLAGLAGRDEAGRRLAFLLVLAFVPAAIAGLLLEDFIDSVLFGMWPVAIAWLVGGVAILALRRLRVGRDSGIELDALTWRHALAIGAFQCLALAPGTSRSLATIAGALLVGLSSAAAIEFSLLLGVVTLTAASAHKALGSHEVLVRDIGPSALAVGFLAAFVSAWIAVRWLVAFVTRRGLFAFGVYRVVLALVVAALLAAGILPAH